MDSLNNKRNMDHISKYDDFFDVKPTLKKVKTTPPPATITQLPKIEKREIKFLPLPAPKQSTPPPVEEIKKQVSTGTGQISKDSILISSWNINGLRAIMKRNELQNYFTKRRPDILCLCETKTIEDSPDTERLIKWLPPDYSYYFSCSKIKKGYSGTGIITRCKPLSVTYGMGVERFDLEGRVINMEFEKFILVVAYVVMSGDDFSKLPLRLYEWDPAFRAHLLKLKEKKHVVVCGDLNVTHKTIDIWGDMGKVAGSSKDEKSNFTVLLNSGFIDTFRHLYPEVRKYSYWSQYLKQRPSNKGRRYDYILVSKEAIAGVKDAFIDNEAYGSDHCPVEIIFNPNFEKEEKKEEVIEVSAPPQEDIEIQQNLKKEATSENQTSQTLTQLLKKISPSGNKQSNLIIIEID